MLLFAQKRSNNGLVTLMAIMFLLNIVIGLVISIVGNYLFELYNWNIFGRVSGEHIPGGFSGDRFRDDLRGSHFGGMFR